jgi:hypothetical protein
MAMTREFDFTRDAISDARETARHFIDEIVEQLRDTGEASRDLFNDYPDGDGWHNENSVDRDYDLLEAAALLDELADHEETDRGLWEGLEPRRAIAAQAAYTFGAAVLHYWSRVIEEINGDADSGILADMLGEDDPASDDVVRQRVLEIIDAAE